MARLGPGNELGPYRLLRELGRGGMGVVFLAEDPRLGRQVALKLLSGRADPKARQRFLTEFRALDRLVHPHILRVFDAGEVGGQLYLATEVVEGSSLAQVLELEGALDLDRALELTEQVAEALEAAHSQGILHRDVKPDNVLLDKQGVPKLADFGLARTDGGQSLTQTGDMLGTPAFMAPEQAAGERHAFGPTLDVYGLGATLYCLLTREPPFKGNSVINTIRSVLTDPPPSVRRVRPDVPPAVEAVLTRALAKEPGERFQSVAAFAEALRGAAAPAPSRGGRPALAAAAIALLGAGAAGAVLFAFDRPPPRIAASPTEAPRGVDGPGERPSPAVSASPGPAVSASPSPAVSASPPPAIPPGEPDLRLDGTRLKDLAQLPSLEVHGFGVSCVSTKGRQAESIRMQAGGSAAMTRIDLPLRLAPEGAAFSLEAEFDVRLLEPDQEFGLALLPMRRPNGPPAPLIQVVFRCQGPGRMQWRGRGQEELFEVRLPPQGAAKVVSRQALLGGTLRLSVRGDRARDELEFDLLLADGSHLTAERALGTAETSDWALQVNANTPPRPGRDPLGLVRVDVHHVELNGFLPREVTGQASPARIGQAGRALVAGNTQRVIAAVGSLDRRGPWRKMGRFLLAVAAAENGDSSGMRALWSEGEKGFARIWKASLPVLPAAARNALGEAYRAEVGARLPGVDRDARWWHDWGHHRVWGDKGNLKGPEGQTDTLGAEQLWLRHEWERAYDYLCESVLACAGVPPMLDAAPEGVALLHLGDLEAAHTILTRSIAAGHGGPFMFSQAGWAAYRLGKWAEALEIWEERWPAHPGYPEWSKAPRPLLRHVQNTLAPRARELLEAGPR